MTKYEAIQVYVRLETAVYAIEQAIKNAGTATTENLAGILGYIEIEQRRCLKAMQP